MDGIDAINAPLDGLPIKDLTFDIDSFEERATQSNSSKRRGSPENSNTHREGRVEELLNKQKIVLKLFSDLDIYTKNPLSSSGQDIWLSPRRRLKFDSGQWNRVML